ncbi:Uncharacterized protein TCM_013441 [Theobroma cacao]|uniref:Uncharacterized protein n=1 Tax=Theobroma cacao TaxID=3641 RepID=A0A061G3I7_THECC|nr:Uncharacterized protein TCM_013441 [Theobroma cacao]
MWSIKRVKRLFDLLDGGKRAMWNKMEKERKMGGGGAIREERRANFAVNLKVRGAALGADFEGWKMKFWLLILKAERQEVVVGGEREREEEIVDGSCM